MPKTIALDFDGVLHSYTSGWQGAEVIADPPVEGMADACHKLADAGFELVVMSSRVRHPGAISAMDAWLHQFGFPKMKITSEKVPALLYVDDRGYRFNGDPSSLLNLIFSTDLEPWNRGSHMQV